MFGLDDFIQHLIDFVKFIGPRSHVVAVCQPVVAALVAIAVMAENRDADQPASLTLMAGPIDARVSPTKVNELATSKPVEWFREKMIGVVPRSLPGAGRRVYPGFLQLAAFMSMNVDRHSKAFVDLFKSRVEGDFEKAEQFAPSTRNISRSWISTRPSISKRSRSYSKNTPFPKANCALKGNW